MAERTLEDCEALLGYAKLEPEDYKNVIQTISFDKDFNSADLFLFELDENVLKYLETGKRLEIKGDSNETAVGCTDTETFALREAETSNALLLLPNLIIPQKDNNSDHRQRSISSVRVLSMKHLYFELKRIRPLIGKLKKILEDSLFVGHVEDEADESVVDHCLTFDQILNQVQASKAELEKALKVLNAVEVDGFIRVIDFDYAHQVLQSSIDVIEEQEWGFDLIPLKELYHQLKGVFPSFVVKAIISQYCEDFSDNSTTVRLDADKVSAHIAEHLLRNVTKFHLAEFEAIWQEAVPNGMVIDFQQLRGTALVDRYGEPPTVSLFRVLDLPDDEEQRFAFLFEKKEKWLFEEIEPLIANLAGNNVTVSSLLTKNCRVSRSKNGDKLYSSRKPK